MTADQSRSLDQTVSDQGPYPERSDIAGTDMPRCVMSIAGMDRKP
jgi:hypothetical protein